VIPNVPSGDVLTVSGAIPWPAAQIPASGAYAFVALLGNAADPAPNLGDLERWDTFVDLVRSNNNVAWCNFHVVSVEPVVGNAPSGFVPIDFMATGAPDRARRMKVDVIARLPTGSRLLLEMPRALYDTLPEGVPVTRGDEQRVRIAMNPHGTRPLGELLFPAKARAQLRLLVQVPKRARNVPHEIYVRQVHGDTEVGRITCRLIPEDRSVRSPAKRKSRRRKR
jgi:hypothetical protein